MIVTTHPDIIEQMRRGEQARVAEGDLWDDLRLELRRIMRQVEQEARA